MNNTKSLNQPRKRNMNLLIILLIILIILTVFFLIILPPSRGNLPKTTIDVDGFPIGLTIFSENPENPVLLVCGGGPGIPQYLVEYLYPSVLSKNFTVCYFDYRGTGLSYSDDICIDDMTTARYLEDVDAVTDYLRERFSQDKIYILGHSFGTYIALNTVKLHPEKYLAYFAMSQNANQKESEYRAYDYMCNAYKENWDAKMLASLEKYPIRESEEIYNTYFSSGVRDKAMHELGVGTARDMKSVITGLFFPSLRCKAYTVKERINLWKGKAASNNFPVTKESISFNAFESISSIEIPIYFFAGEYDYTCCESLQREYYEFIEAPVKEYILFENTAHSPIYEDGAMADEIFQRILPSIEIVTTSH